MRSPQIKIKPDFVNFIYQFVMTNSKETYFCKRNNVLYLYRNNYIV